MNQPSLLDAVVRAEKPYKRVRQTSRESYRRQRAIDVQKAQDGEEERKAQVLRCLAAWWNRHQEWPTARELYEGMRQIGESVDDINSVRPRLTSLCDVGLVEAGAKRKCRCSGRTVHVWRITQR